MLSDLVPHRCWSTIRILDDVTRLGIALLNDVSDSAELLILAGMLGAVAPRWASRPDGVTVIEDPGNMSSGMAGFSHQGLTPHTDRSSVDAPPGLLLTACAREPATGGESLLADGQAVYEDLAESNPEALKALCAPKSALFGGADGYLGSVFSAHHNVIAVRLRLDNLVRFSPTVTPHLPALRAAIARHTRTLPLPAGAGYVLNNHRWLHGRHSFTGNRALYRITANPHRDTVPSGFRSAARPGAATHPSPRSTVTLPYARSHTR